MPEFFGVEGFGAEWRIQRKAWKMTWKMALGPGVANLSEYQSHIWGLRRDHLLQEDDIGSGETSPNAGKSQREDASPPLGFIGIYRGWMVGCTTPFANMSSGDCNCGRKISCCLVTGVKTSRLRFEIV